MRTLPTICSALLVALATGCVDTEPNIDDQALPDPVASDEIVTERPTVEVDPEAPPEVDLAPDPRETLRELVAMSSRVAHVECDSAQPRPQGATIVTDVSCRVIDALDGGDTARISFTLPGGRVGTREVVQFHVPRIDRGDRGVLLLSDRADVEVPAIAFLPEQPDYSFALGRDTFTADNLRAVAQEVVR